MFTLLAALTACTDMSTADRYDTYVVGDATMRVDGGGASLSGSNAAFALTTTRVGRAAHDAPGVREWFLQDGDGVEHGWDVDARPAGEGALTIDVQVEGAEVTAETETSLLFLADAGGIYRYSGLEAWDADGVVLPAEMVPTRDGLRVTVDDSNARYPVSVDPILTSIGVNLGALGYASEPIGDVNGDGYADLLMSTGGSPRLVYGGAGGPAVGSWVDVSDPTADGVYYRSDAAGGDFNGDGYGDVVVSGWSFSAVGCLSIHYGGPAGLGVPAATTIVNTGADFGFAVDVGDFNGDGYADIATGGNQAANVYYGSPSGPPSSPSITLPFFARDMSAYEVEAGGDYDGDGYDDLAIGAFGTTVGGSVILYRGSAHGLDNIRRPLRLNNPLGSGLYGNALDSGDFNADGRDELLVGARDYSDNRGAAFLYQGSSALGLVTTAVWSTTGTNVGDYTGLVLAFLGDTNLDGRDDFILSHVFDTSGGTVYTYDGTASGVPGAASTTVTGSATIVPLGDSALGGNLQGPGDMNGDGKGDALVGGISGSSSYIYANYLFWGN